MFEIMPSENFKVKQTSQVQLRIPPTFKLILDRRWRRRCIIGRCWHLVCGECGDDDVATIRICRPRPIKMQTRCQMATMVHSRHRPPPDDTSCAHAGSYNTQNSQLFVYIYNEMYEQAGMRTCIVYHDLLLLLLAIIYAIC